MPDMTAVASTRMAASMRRCIGTRETSSTVSRRARGGQAAMASLMGLRSACRMLAATDAPTANARVARTAQRMRCSDWLPVPMWLVLPFLVGGVAVGGVGGGEDVGFLLVD